MGQLKELNLKKVLLAKNIIQFDNLVTGPLHGFLNASHYYKECSSIFSISNIRVPTKIVNALNDPILSPECYPYEEVKNNPLVELKTPSYGGHVGFIALILKTAILVRKKPMIFWSPTVLKPASVKLDSLTFFLYS